MRGITQSGDFGASNLGNLLDDIKDVVTSPTSTATTSVSTSLLTDNQRKYLLVAALMVAAYIAYKQMKAKHLI